MEWGVLYCMVVWIVLNGTTFLFGIGYVELGIVQ